MRRLNGFEEYVGYWKSDGGNFSSFRMFIDEEAKFGRIRFVSGRIKDKYGRARFGGEIWPTRVRFAKKYEKEHSDTGRASGDVVFEGELAPEINFGRRHYAGAYVARNWKQEIVSTGTFVLEKYVPTRTLEFLMREDMGNKWRRVK